MFHEECVADTNGPLYFFKWTPDFSPDSELSADGSAAAALATPRSLPSGVLPFPYPAGAPPPREGFLRPFGLSPSGLLPGAVGA